jgi:hypothetical protein
LGIHLATVDAEKNGRSFEVNHECGGGDSLGHGISLTRRVRLPRGAGYGWKKIEERSVRELTGTMEAQLLNYLRLSKAPVGYLINFCNAKVEWRRFVLGP